MSRVIFLIMCSYVQKSIKKDLFHPQNAGNGTCGTVNFKIFPGEDAAGPRYDARGYTPLVVQTYFRPPPPNSWPVRLCPQVIVCYVMFNHFDPMS